MAIWDQLNTKTIKDVASEDIQRQSDAIHLEEENRQALEDTVLINKATLRDGEPMPDSGAIWTYTASDNTDIAVVRPPAGQVWEIIGISGANSAALSASQSYYFYYSDPTTEAASAVPAGTNDLLISSIVSSSTIFPWETLSEDIVPRRVLATNQLYPRLYSNFTGVGGGETFTWIVGYVRIR